METRKLQTLLEDAGYETQSYSGRGMYGKSCLGVVTERPFRMIADCTDVLADDLDGCLAEDAIHDELVALGEALRGARQDNMGRDIIVYFPDVEYDNEADVELEGGA